jgi:hypothetical protein
MKQQVFYSWQSDTVEAANRYFIRDALSAATKKLQWDLEVDEATRGVPGSPVIFEAILAKVNRCAVFVADLTICGKYTNDKSTPNPNVLVEYGYSLRAVGDDRIITVLNRHYGGPERLPFDLKTRGVKVIYELGPDLSAEKRKTALASLTGLLARELATVMEKSLFRSLGPKGAEAVKLLVEESDVGAFGYPHMDFAGFCHRLEIDERVGRSLVDQLEGRGLITHLGALGDSLIEVRTLDSLFWNFDKMFMSWDVKDDALAIAEMLVNGEHEGHNQLVSARLSQQLKWEPRRLNPALTYLVEHGVVRASNTNSYPFAHYSIMETPETRRFVWSQKGTSGI